MADNSAQHIIRKQFIDLIVSKRENIFDLQNELSEFYYSEILPLLEKIFDEVSGDAVITIDRIELNLGRFSAKEFTRQIKEREILEKIEKLLYGKFDARGHKDAIPAAVSKRPAFSAFEQWIYYMRRGSLPWNLLQIDDVWRNLVLENLATDYNSVTLLRQLLRKDD